LYHVPVMKQTILPVMLATALATVALAAEPIKLPAAKQSSDTSLEAALAKRRSMRSYAAKPLTLPEVAQLLWAAQGVTDGKGHRTAPSARALYALEMYVVPQNVTGLAPGVYKYKPAAHELDLVVGEDRRKALLDAASGQASVREAAAVFVITAAPERMGPKSGENGKKFSYMEAGFAAQNLLLEVVSLNMGAVVVGGMNPGAVKAVIDAPAPEEVMCLIPVGRLP
jgi:SagB-type dehydrogenase family enzyme